jgi:hypothetical protein
LAARRVNREGSSRYSGAWGLLSGLRGRSLSTFAELSVANGGGSVLTTILYGILIVVAALVGLVLAQRLIPLHLREQSNTATGTIYAALYVMFGVSLGFSLFLVWQQFNTARQTAENEATSLQQIYSLAARFPDSEQDRVKELAVSYARVVVEEEWPSLKQGRPSPRAATLLLELRRSVEDLDPQTDAQNNLYSASLTELDELEESRALRLLSVRQGIPSILWVVLVVGGTLTVAFTYLFGMERAWLHAVAVAGLTTAICLILYVIAVLDYPFNSGVSVEPDAFELVLRVIEDDGGP